MSNGSEPTVSLGLSIERIRDGDTFTASLSETIFSFLLGINGGTETKTSRGEGVRFLGAWCPEEDEPGGPEATAFTTAWALKHDHPKQHAFSKTLVAVASTADLRDGFGRVLALVRCTYCGACLNEDLVVNGHATPQKVRVVRERRPGEYAQHARALTALKTVLGNGKRFGAETLLRTMQGQQPMVLET